MRTRTHLSMQRRAIRCAIAATFLAGMAGCAQLPQLKQSATFQTVEELAGEQSFAALPAPWPSQDWWRKYGDAQLDGLIGEAARGSPSLATVEARVNEAAAMTQIAGATRLPTVDGDLSLSSEKQSYNSLMPRAAVPNGWHSYGQATLDLSWELDFWGKNRSALAAAVSDEAAARTELEEARLILATSVAASYADLAQSYAIRDTAEEAVAVRGKTTTLFRERYHNELETLGSVRQTESRLAAAEAELAIIDERIALQKNAISALLGAGPDRALAISRPSIKFANSTALPSSLPLDLIGRRPDIVAARLRAEAAAHRIDQQKAGFYPSVNLMAFVGVQSLGIANLTKSGSDIGGVGPAVTLPIFNTERLQGQLRGAHAEYDAAVSTYNATLSMALHDVANAAVSRRSLNAELVSLQASVGGAQDAYRITNDRYRGQLANYLDVLTAEDTLLSARRQLADVQSRALTLDVALVRALGGGFDASGSTQN
jgi:NodT family efflux transporter outer membrane factor (OMF) lipoprotein